MVAVLSCEVRGSLVSICPSTLVTQLAEPHISSKTLFLVLRLRVHPLRTGARPPDCLSSSLTNVQIVSLTLLITTLRLYIISFVLLIPLEVFSRGQSSSRAAVRVVKFWSERKDGCGKAFGLFGSLTNRWQEDLSCEAARPGGCIDIGFWGNTWWYVHIRTHLA